MPLPTRRQAMAWWLKSRAFIPHDSRLRFGRLNHVQTDAFNQQNGTTGTSEITP